MHKYLTIILISLFLFVLPSFAADPLTPVEIAQRVYDRYIGDDMQMRGTMELMSKNGRVRIREFVSMRKEYNAERKQLIRFTAPADIDGTAFLTLEADNSNKTEQHLYLPALKRTRRIVDSQKGRRFVNSDFTYEDMRRQPVASWNYQLDGVETISGNTCYILVSTPKPDTDTQYSKAVSWVEKGNFIPLKAIFWDRKGQKTKGYTVVSFTTIDQIATETVVLMEDYLSGHKTRLKSMDIKYNTGLKDSLFTSRALER